MQILKSIFHLHSRFSALIKKKTLGIGMFLVVIETTFNSIKIETRSSSMPCFRFGFRFKQSWKIKWIKNDKKKSNQKWKFAEAMSQCSFNCNFRRIQFKMSLNVMKISVFFFLSSNIWFFCHSNFKEVSKKSFERKKINKKKNVLIIWPGAWTRSRIASSNRRIGRCATTATWRIRWTWSWAAAKKKYTEID